MTYKDFVEQYGSDAAKQMLALIAAVIKKREPKPPAEIDDEYGYFKCPTCGELIYCTESRFEDHKYCLNCGQAIYWRKKEVFNQSTDMQGKKILDACCGSRMFWFDRNNPDVIFADNRKLETTLCDERTLVIEPDIIVDFRNMPFDDNTFNLVVFDPPHLIHAGENSWLSKKYGVLPLDWKPYIKAGFDECVRVLRPGHVLIMKWNEEQIKTADMLKAIGHKPLFGDRRSKTRWMCFMKGED